VEDAGTFAGNARKKAVELARWVYANARGEFQGAEAVCVLADDSGLEVDALQGAPGVHSARFAALDGRKGNSSDAENNVKLLRLLSQVPAEQRTARFRCVLALSPVRTVGDRGAGSEGECEPESATRLFEGCCEGRIAFAPSGAGGFGYDPLFLPEGYNSSFAELGEDVKNRISHRARALAALRVALKA